MADLYSKIFGCIAGSRIGSSMSMPTEHMPIEKIEETFGVLDELRPIVQKERVFRWALGPKTHKKYYEFPAGSTEDGIERQKLIADAIITKQDRINSQDLAESWLRNIEEHQFGYALHWSDKPYYEMLKAGMHPGYIGLFSLWPGIVSLARSCHPIGIINAGDPRQAADDIFAIGGIYHQLHGSGIQTAASVAAAIAEAMKPDATVESVLEAACAYVDEPVREEFEEVFAIAREAKTLEEMRRKINDRYIYRYGEQKSSGEEVVSRGLAIFFKTGGDVRESIIHGVNFGRDTDCTSAVAAGVAGAFSGAGNIPSEWVETVDEATRKNEKITVCRRTLAETTDGLYNALQASLARKHRQWELFADFIGTEQRGV